MSRNGLTDMILALLHAVVTPHHRCQILAPAPSPPQQSPPSAAPHHRVLERPPSPSPDLPAYRLMEPSSLDASPWGRRDRPCAVHGWGCPNRVAPAQGPSSLSHQGEEKGREEEIDEHHITVVTGPVRAPVTRRMTSITICPQDRPQGPLHLRPSLHRYLHRPHQL
jgi:hypothetical protein